MSDAEGGSTRTMPPVRYRRRMQEREDASTCATTYSTVRSGEMWPRAMSATVTAGLRWPPETWNPAVTSTPAASAFAIATAASVAIGMSPPGGTPDPATEIKSTHPESRREKLFLSLDRGNEEIKVDGQHSRDGSFVRTGGHGGGDSGEDEKEGEDELGQHGAHAAGVLGAAAVVARVHEFGHQLRHGCGLLAFCSWAGEDED
jgi:hypothetical protein